MSTAVSLTVTTRLRWWFKPWKFAVLAWVFVTGREPSTEWTSKWVRRAARIEVK
jgi:hypothetical protein